MNDGGIHPQLDGCCREPFVRHLFMQLLPLGVAESPLSGISLASTPWCCRDGGTSLQLLALGWMLQRETFVRHLFSFYPIESIERMSLKLYLVVSVPSTGVSNAREAKNVLLLVQNLCAKCVLSMGDPAPPSVYLGTH